MNLLDYPIFYAAFILVLGLRISVFAALNVNLGARLQNAELAATITLSVGIFACLGIILLSGENPNLVVESSILFFPIWAGCLLSSMYWGMFWIATKFGVGNAVPFVLLGQIITMTIIVHFSLLGAKYHPVTEQRFLGIALMAIGDLISFR